MHEGGCGEVWWGFLDLGVEEGELEWWWWEVSGVWEVKGSNAYRELGDEAWSSII